MVIFLNVLKTNLNIPKWLNHPAIQFFVFSGALWLIFVHLHLNRDIDQFILGPHFWRKSDTYAQIMNYYYNGLNFFDHGIYYNQMDSNGKALAEFPLIYYLIALQLKLIGNYPLIIKLNWLFISFSGLFSIFKISQHFTKNWLVSFGISVLLFLSPVYAFYNVDYLPDPLALNFSFIGMWFLVKHIKNQKRKNLVYGLVFLSISGMIKPFYLIPFLAFLGLILFNQWFFKNDKLQFKWVYFSPLLMVVVWFGYVSWYNQLVGSHYFLSTIRPIWSLNSEQMDEVFNQISKFWLADYLNYYLYWVFGVSILVNLVWWSKKDVLINIYFVLSFLGSLAYLVIMFDMLKHHDYYVFPVLFLVVFSIGLMVYKIINWLADSRISYAIGLVGLVFVFFGMDYSFDRLQRRRQVDWINSKSYLEKYQNLDDFLDKNNVKNDDLIVAFSDKSPSYALSLAGRKGWSGFQTKFKLMSIDEMITSGAKYLIINESFPQSQEDSTLIRPYQNYQLDQENGITIYDLRPYQN